MLNEAVMVESPDDKEVAISRIRAGLAWVLSCIPNFTGSYQVTVHWLKSKPKKVEREIIRDHEQIG